MSEKQKEIIRKIVYTFAQLANKVNKQACDDFIDRLTNMDINDCIDTILVSLNSLLNRGTLTQDDIFSNVNLLLSLNPEEYKEVDDLLKRLSWLKSMNMEYTEMPLSVNHRLILEVFDKFNKLLAGKFDCFYTGGIMGYLAIKHELERYHSDLDLFINEQQLEILYELVNQSEDFEFVSNMDHKEVHGHEYKIVYRGTTISIGLFLFERSNDNSIIIKQYYYDAMGADGILYVDEHHLSKEYTSLVFDEEIKYHNGILYKMQTLESIYNSKKKSRPKDRYDAHIIRPYVDMLIDYKLDTEKGHNFDVHHKDASSSMVAKMEEKIYQLNIGKNSSLK